MAKATTLRKPTGGSDLPEDPDDNYQPPATALVPMSEKEIDAAILASASGSVAREIAEGVLNATTVDDILGSVDPTESLVGIIFRPIEWAWRRSTFGNKKGAFVVLKVVDGDGRERTVTSGSLNIMAALRAFEQSGLDIPALTVRESVTADGNTVYRFAKARAA
jgi:hypothetical protein